MSEYIAALRRRLAAVAGTADLTQALRHPASPARLWLVLAAVAANFPTTAEFQRVKRLASRELVPSAEPDQLAGEILGIGLNCPARNLLSDVELIQNRPLILSAESPNPLPLPDHVDVIISSSLITTFEFADRLGCLARFSGSRLVISHRANLLTSESGPQTFAALKHAHEVVVRNRPALVQLTALFGTLPNQGLTQPQVIYEPDEAQP